MSEYVLETSNLTKVYSKTKALDNLNLKIRSPMSSEPMFKLELRAPSRTSAINACKLWRDKAPLIYESVFENLIEEE